MKLGDNKALEVPEKVIQKIDIKEGKKNIHNIYYALGLKHNLFERRTIGGEELQGCR